MHPESPLPTRLLAPGASLVQSEPWLSEPVTLDSPALSVMTDLAHVKAAATSPKSSLRQAEQLMIYLGVRMLFVVSEMPDLEGLITSTDLRGIRAMRVVQQRGVRHDELTVGDVMVDLSALDAISHYAMRRASVSNLIATLKLHGRNHLLVVQDDTPDAPLRVSGVVSRAQIERQLGHAIDLVEVAETFADVGRMLA